MSWFEAVPNFSEGRDATVVAALADAARSVPGVSLLDVESNSDHHRSVVSLAGEGAALVEALVRMARIAVARIDLTRHRGEHPRMGAVDVIPFVPLGDSTMDQAVQLAVALGERLVAELSLPVYLYGAAARRPERADLAVVRRGQFEGLRDAVANEPDRRPDLGGPALHPTAGAVAVGARPVLIAFNANLGSTDLALAKAIARKVRARDGGLPEVKALGFELAERHQVQVSMNLTDYRTTPVHRALEAVRAEAERAGVRVTDTEVVGLIPEDALYDAAEFYLGLERFDRAAVLERKIRGARPTLQGTPLARFAELLAARSPTPGGGSAAAAAAALGTALGEMVAAYSGSPAAPDAALDELRSALAAARGRLLAAVDADTSAYEELRATRRARKAAPDDAAAQAAYARAVEGAIRVPLATARDARAVADRLAATRGRFKSALGSDLTTALALLEAAIAGALANAEINLPDLGALGAPTAPFQTEIETLRRARS